MRKPVFDIMKGIGILAMIIGHCHIPHFLELFIFTWHMPLFFIISGFFFHYIDNKECLKKNFRILIVPYLITAIIMFGISILYVLAGSTLVSSSNAFWAIIVGAGSKNLPSFQNYFVGAIWFLQALFWCRIIYNYIYSRLYEMPRLFAVLFISVVCTYIASDFYIPTNILQGCSALLFYEIGYQTKNRMKSCNNNSSSLVLCTLLLVFLSIHSGSMSMARCYYGFFPINVLCAFWVTIMCYRLSEKIMLFPKLSEFLAYVGKISIVILCVHIIDLNYGLYPLLNSHVFHFDSLISDIVLVLWRILIALLVSYYLVKIKIVSKLFNVSIIG